MSRIFAQRELHVRKVILVVIHRESQILTDEICLIQGENYAILSNSRGELFSSRHQSSSFGLLPPPPPAANVIKGQPLFVMIIIMTTVMMRGRSKVKSYHSQSDD